LRFWCNLAIINFDFIFKGNTMEQDDLTQKPNQKGPLAGIRLVELAGIGPGPFAAMMLADQGAQIIRLERAGSMGLGDARLDILNRSRPSLKVDLKSALIEGFRPGVMERLGLGPDACLALNPKLVYGRMTGWGQTGPLAQTAGHDINYIALAGALHAFGRAGDKPTPPINMVGDFGGGGMLLAFGMVCALLEASRSGLGQVVDAAMIDGAALLMSMIWSFKAMGLWQDQRGVNLLDTGAHFYDTYETADGQWLAVGAIEPQFYAEFLKRAGLEGDEALQAQMDAQGWPALKAKLTQHFLGKTRAQWEAIFGTGDACVTPVLSLAQVPEHPHCQARQAFISVAGQIQPAPAPRYSRTPCPQPSAPQPAQSLNAEILSAILSTWGLPETDIQAVLSQR
jgi:alpha-methylacyl-CoA racemase